MPKLITHIGLLLGAGALMLTRISAAAVPLIENQSECSVQLDAAVTLINDGNAPAATRLLERLDRVCRHLPQIQHNLGVLAARDKNWTRAMPYFQRSLAGDERAADTAEHLQRIHKFRAALAYARALGSQGPIDAPLLQLQDSTRRNAESRRLAETVDELRSVSTLEYELYAWWDSRVRNDRREWIAHYATGYPAPPLPALMQGASVASWDDVPREIAFTRHDAVVVLGSPDGSATRLMLLLRLQGNRWKIYQETSL